MGEHRDKMAEQVRKENFKLSDSAIKIQSQLLEAKEKYGEDAFKSFSSSDGSIPFGYMNPEDMNLEEEPQIDREALE